MAMHTVSAQPGVILKYMIDTTITNKTVAHKVNNVSDGTLRKAELDSLFAAIGSASGLPPGGVTGSVQTDSAGVFVGNSVFTYAAAGFQVGFGTRSYFNLAPDGATNTAILDLSRVEQLNFSDTNGNNILEVHAFDSSTSLGVGNSNIKTNTKTGTDTLNAPNGVDVSNLAGNGSGFVAVSNAGILSWSSGPGPVAHYDSVNMTANTSGFLAYSVPPGTGYSVYSVGAWLTINATTGGGAAELIVIYTNQKNTVQNRVPATVVTNLGSSTGVIPSISIGTYQFATFNIAVKKGTSITIEWQTAGSSINFDGGAAITLVHL